MSVPQRSPESRHRVRELAERRGAYDKARYFTPKEEARIIDAFRDGVPIQDLAARFGVACQRIREVVR